MHVGPPKFPGLLMGPTYLKWIWSGTFSKVKTRHITRLTSASTGIFKSLPVKGRACSELHCPCHQTGQNNPAWHQEADSLQRLVQRVQAQDNPTVAVKGGDLLLVELCSECRRDVAPQRCG